MAPTRQRHCCRRRTAIVVPLAEQSILKPRPCCFRAPVLQTSCVRSFGSTDRSLVPRALSHCVNRLLSITIRDLPIGIKSRRSITACNRPAPIIPARSARDLVKANLRAIKHPGDYREINRDLVHRSRSSIGKTTKMSQSSPRTTSRLCERDKDTLTNNEDCMSDVCI